MNILVTGGAGFIGSHVSRLLLDKGHQVVVLDNLSHGFRENVDSRTKLIVADMRDFAKTKKALKSIDAVIHMAGLISVPESVADPVKYCDNNVVGTVNLLECMRNTGVKKIIFSSSACVYGTCDQLPIKEDTPIRPDNPYGATKASIEVFLKSYNEIFAFDVVILRYFNPYGPGKLAKPTTLAIPNFIEATLSRKPLPLYWKGEQIRDFIYIDDLAQAHVDVLPLSGFNIFNLGMEKGIKVKDVAKLIFDIVGYKVPIADLGERPGDVSANYASSAKIRKTIGWKAKVGLREGLKRTIAFYRNQGTTM